MADFVGLNGNDYRGHPDHQKEMPTSLPGAAAEPRSTMPTPPPEPSSPVTSPAVKSTTLSIPSPVALPASAPAVPITTALPNGHSKEIPALEITGHVNSGVEDPDAYAVKSPSMSEPTSAIVERRYEGQSKTRNRSSSGSDKKSPSHDRVRRLSAVGMQQLAEEPTSLPVAVVPDGVAVEQLAQEAAPSISISEQLKSIRQEVLRHPNLMHSSPFTDSGRNPRSYGPDRRPAGPRTLSTPPGAGRRMQAQSSSPRRNSFNPSARPPPLHLNLNGQPHGARSAPRPSTHLRPPQHDQPMPSPVPPSIPLPPMSIPTHLQLEMSTQRPSPLYIHNSHINDIPYESMAVKIERLKNLLLLIPYLERTLCFGALACLDAWLYNFTILPMRFVVAIGILVRWWLYVINKEMRWAIEYVWTGIGRLRTRSRRGSVQSQCSECVDSTSADPIPDRGQSKTRRSVSSHDHGPGLATGQNGGPPDLGQDIRMNGNGHTHHHNHHPPGRSRHRRTKSLPSNLTSRHKADLLQGGIIILSCIFLMKLDASRMYHVIRGQDAIKLYVIYSVLEVGDRLLSALGQDIFECLISDEALSRNKFGRSKLLLPLGLFFLALFYTIVHSVVLYFQVISLNVAVNSYSNALLTLLLSNQFVEIKSTVFKRFDKDNLFQLTCADITERFQIWLMIFIIGMRNVVEVGGLSVPGTGYWDSSKATSTKPLHSPSILPHAFTVLPSWLWSGEVLSPFLIVIGSEILVDFIKHAYINKFNKIRCKFYSRILDILCKDYYTNAFINPTMTRRVGLAVIPLSCLFIRASVQTYHMFLSAHVPAPILESTQTSLTEESATPSSPVMLAALDRLDTLLRDALGRAVYGSASANEPRSFMSWNTDDVIAALTMLVVFFIAFLVLLIIKILLGMGLLWFARNRYAAMKQKEYLVSVGQTEPNAYDAKGRRLGGYGHVEVSDDKHRWIHADKDEGLKGKGRPEKASKQPDGEYHGVQRWEMVTKRIW